MFCFLLLPRRARRVAKSECDQQLMSDFFWDSLHGPIQKGEFNSVDTCDIQCALAALLDAAHHNSSTELHQTCRGGCAGQTWGWMMQQQQHQTSQQQQQQMKTPGALMMHPCKKTNPRGLCSRGSSTSLRLSWQQQTGSRGRRRPSSGPNHSISSSRQQQRSRRGPRSSSSPVRGTRCLPSPGCA